MKDKDTIIQLLKPYFEKRDDVVMAFLFGSFARDIYCEDSDVDIAVYFKTESRHMEWEAFDARYECECDIWRDIENILGREVDLLVLNRAASIIAEDAISSIPIIIKDRGLYLDFMLKITSEAIDFRNFVEDYFRLKHEMKDYAQGKR